MLLTLRTTHIPATDLASLLHKDPGRVESLELSFGQAHVFFPEADETACTAAVLLDVDPVGLVRGEGGTLDRLVNDRPYVTSSFLSVAIARLFDAALEGRSPSRPERTATAIPLEAKVAALPCRGGEDLLRRLFEPLGYRVAAEPLLLDPTSPEWGPSPYFNVTLRAVCRVGDLLAHLCVLIPVLDAGRHDGVGEEEVETLLRHGEGWLSSHPERDLIARRSLEPRRSLVDDAVGRLVDEEPEPGAAAERRNAEEADLERPLGLDERRLGAVLALLQESGARKVVDLGCGEGELLARLLADSRFEEVAGMDVSVAALERAAARLGLDRLPPRQRERIRLFQGSLLYRDARLAGFDAAAVVEVVEHLDPPRLAAFERVVFEFARPGTVVLTTPNAESNVRWPSLPAGRFRHRDHRFEWTREELRRWAEGVAGRFGYAVRFLPVGEEDPQVGPPTQMAVFAR
jgi:3' terminal RNA ribose 2'-O-methyltransferase Hen1